jgi:putative transposase
MVTPAARRKAAAHLVAQLGLSERRACRLVGLSRSVHRYASCRRSDECLRTRLKGLAEQYPLYGYPTFMGC